jgi:site-specific DNA recombinase
MKALYARQIAETYYEQTREIQLEKKQVTTQIKDYEHKLSNARNLIASGKIDADDFRQMKTDYVNNINRLEAKLHTIINDTANIEGLLDEGIERLLKLDEGAQKGDLGDIRSLVAKIYPDNFTFDGYKVRTTRTNTVMDLIYLINKELDKNEKGQTRN